MKSILMRFCAFAEEKRSFGNTWSEVWRLAAGGDEKVLKRKSPDGLDSLERNRVATFAEIYIESPYYDQYSYWDRDFDRVLLPE